ncbi:hypothetical protein RB2083_568 [Rhodobacteraceae bacterium HTCC2083]|nr:hypothetical protein RB2083_568 [Rhodobacteraceae bacterium HTCC2083]
MKDESSVARISELHYSHAYAASSGASATRILPANMMRV